LPLPCWIRPTKIASIEPERIDAVIGAVAPQELDQVRAILRRIID
jgi:hypothetical protein